MRGFRPLVAFAAVIAGGCLSAAFFCAAAAGPHTAPAYAVAGWRLFGIAVFLFACVAAALTAVGGDDD